MIGRWCRFAAVGIVMASHQAAAAPVRVVAAENVYGDIARQIGGADVTVRSILANPDQDPHLFEVSPSVGRAVSKARIVIYNGIEYDPWMRKILTAAGGPDCQVLVVAELGRHKPGDNPHVWYDLATIRALAERLDTSFAAADPAHRADYGRRLAVFEASLAPVDARIASLRSRTAGMQVTATEPVFGYMFAALGMRVRDMGFQLAVMNDTEPSASDISGFETDLASHAVGLLVYNSQATDRIADRMKALAQQAHVPIVGATETEPGGMDYQAWMLAALQAVDAALPKPPS